MSQHICPSSLDGNPATIVIGWDRLGGYFMTLRRDNADGADEGDDDEDDSFYLYDSWVDPALTSTMGLSLTLDYFVGKLAELHVSYPDTLIRELLVDALAGGGNRFVRYNQEGQIVPV